MNVDLIRVLVAVVAVGIGLAGLMLASFRGLRREMMGLRHEMRDEIQGLRHETRQDIRDMRGHMGRIDSHIGELRERMAQVEGLLKGLRDAFVQGITPN